MHPLAAVAVLVLATPPVTADHAPAVETEIKQLELTLAGYLSRGELDAYAPHLAEDYRRISDDERIMSKAEVLAQMRAPTGPRTPLEPTRLTVRAYGDTAILTGDLVLGPGRSRFTKAFLRRAGRWVMVNNQGTALIEKTAPRRSRPVSR